jgi:hypothetical protein
MTTKPFDEGPTEESGFGDNGNDRTPCGGGVGSADFSGLGDEAARLAGQTNASSQSERNFTP